MRVKRWRSKLIILCLLGGVLYSVELRYGFMRLRDVEMTPRGAVSDVVVWQSVPRNAETFWPALLVLGRKFTRGVEKFYPVELKIRLTGWGRYRVTIAPLEALLCVSWNSKLWLLSTNGRMWLANLPANAKVKGIIIPNKPILAWDQGMALPIDTEGQTGDVYPSSLPIAKIRKWYEVIERIGWNDKIYCLLAKKIDGKPVVQVLLGSEAGITGEIILKEDTEEWPYLAAALEEKYPGSERGIPSGLIVNATYKDIFTVTSKDAR
ncbi:MAG: hypothetical protein LBT08_08625 [Synergistaceae bacterium]|nr:hypothetical protein [Synergistaceae bacterium]